MVKLIVVLLCRKINPVTSRSVAHPSQCLWPMMYIYTHKYIWKLKTTINRWSITKARIDYMRGWVGRWYRYTPGPAINQISSPWAPHHNTRPPHHEKTFVSSFTHGHPNYCPSSLPASELDCMHHTGPKTSHNKSSLTIYCYLCKENVQMLSNEFHFLCILEQFSYIQSHLVI